MINISEIKNQAKFIKQHLENHGYKVTHSSRIKYCYIAQIKFLRKGKYINLPVERNYRYYYSHDRWYVYDNEPTICQLILEALILRDEQTKI